MVGTWSRDQNELWAGAFTRFSLVETWLTFDFLRSFSGLNATTGEHVDVADLGLVGAQLNLVKAIKATGTPTVVVFVRSPSSSSRGDLRMQLTAHLSGVWTRSFRALDRRKHRGSFLLPFSCSPRLSLPFSRSLLQDAIVQQFYPGEAGGTVIAELLTGLENFSGKMSLSVPRGELNASSSFELSVELTAFNPFVFSKVSVRSLPTTTTRKEADTSIQERSGKTEP